MTQTLRDVRLFVAAYEERSFTAAAEREHATQSGVSQHIRKLELRLGVDLFFRESGRVTPTPAADTYYLRCVEILRLDEVAIAEVARFGRGLNGEVTIGLMPTLTRCALAPALDRFGGLHPNVNVRVVEGYSGPLTQQVRTGELDFAIVPAAPGTAGLRSRHFIRTPEVLVCAAARGLTAGEPVRLRDLGPLKVLIPEAMNTRNHTLRSYFSANAVDIERLMELDSMMGTLDYVAKSDWLTVLPQVMMARDVAAGLTVSPIVDPALSLDLDVVEPARRPMSPAAEAIFALLEEETGRLNDT